MEGVIVLAVSVAEVGEDILGNGPLQLVLNADQRIQMVAPDLNLVAWLRLRPETLSDSHDRVELQYWL